MYRSLSIVITVVGVGIGSTVAGELHDAVRAYDTSAMRTLLDAGVKPDESDFFLGTPLHVAVSEQNEDAVRLLIEHGANIEAPSELNRMRALHIASRLGDASMIGLLLDEGANIDSRSGSDQTALLISIQSEQLDAIKVLLERGANTEAVEGNEGFTALAISCFQGNLEIANALINAGADVRATTSNGRSMIFLASSTASYSNVGSDELLQLLVELGADINLPDDAGFTALSYAESRNTQSYRKIAADLRKLGAR